MSAFGTSSALVVAWLLGSLAHTCSDAAPAEPTMRFEPWANRAPATQRKAAIDHWRDPARAGDGVVAWTAIDEPMHGSQWRATGRVTRVRRAFDPGQGASTLWLGSSSGGLWKQRLADARWLPVSDTLFASPAVGDFAVRSDGRILLASGDPWRYPGDGVHLSDDGGQNWTAANLPQTPASIYRMAIDANDDDRVWIATPVGLMRSDDGGDNFNMIMAGHFSEIVQDPQLPARWYAASQQHGILRSDDGGSQFAPDLPSGWPGLGALGRVRIAPSAAEVGLVFALVCDAGNTTMLLRRRAGGAWQSAHPAPDFGWGQSFHTCALAAHPSDPQTLVAGAGGAEISRDALATTPTWAPFSPGHSDSTSFLWDAPDAFLAGNDGGLYRIELATLAVDDSEIARGLSLGQVFAGGALALADDTPGTASVGYQDNGIARVGLAATPVISHAGEADASWITVSPLAASRVGAVIGIPFSRYLSFNDGANFSQISCPLGQHGGVSLPLLFDPAPGPDPQVRFYYTGGAAGATKFSRHDLSRPCTSAVQTIQLSGSSTFRADYLDIARDPEQLRAYVTDSAASGETRIARVRTPPGLRHGALSHDWLAAPEPRPGRAIVDPFRPQRVLWWANRLTGPPALWINDQQGDAGAWRDASGDLAFFGAGLVLHRPATDPDDPDRLWLATGLGVLTTADGQSWQRAHAGLPAVLDAVEMRSEVVDGSPPRHRLWLGTYGRGLWLRETTIDRIHASGFED
jgi:hypothetical protein